MLERRRSRIRFNAHGADGIDRELAHVLEAAILQPENAVCYLADALVVADHDDGAVALLGDVP